MTLTPDAIDALTELARDSAEGEMLEVGRFYAYRLGDKLETVDLTGNEYRDQPKRRTGTTRVRDVASFLALWGKYADSDSEIYADRDQRTITAVLNAHHGVPSGDGDDPGARWADHRVVLQLKHSDAFTAWHNINGRAQSQTAFAEFIEDHRADVRDPSAADLLELAQDFQATAKVTFRSGSALKSGARTLNYVQQIDATAGKNGQLTIPDELQLAMGVFEGATVADQITARLRYRIDGDGKLVLIVVLDQIGDVVNAAFEGVIAEVDAGVEVSILRGTPA
jgi:uncharacterized protein YfdQ (DUF2303 family)